jgi:hypothetical protein
MKILLTMLLLGLTVPQQGEGVVTGVILSADGQPAANVRVALSPADSVDTLLSITLTDSMGRYRIENAPAGRYHLVAGWTARPTYLPGVSARAEATILTIAASSVLEAPVLRLAATRGPSVKGRVNGIRPGQTIGSFEFDLLGGDEATRRTKVNVAADGSFDVEGLAAGTYEVYLLGRVVAAFAFTNNDKTIEFGLKPAREGYQAVKGRVNPALAAAQQPAILEFDLIGGNIKTRRTRINLDPDGSFEVLGLPSGVYEVYLQGRVVSTFRLIDRDIAELVLGGR